MSAGPKRNWQPITIHPIVTDKYPATTTSSIGALHDVAYYQGMLSNQNNYAKDGRLDVYEISVGQFIQQTFLDDAQCRSYLGVSAIHLGTKITSSYDCIGHQLHVSQQKGLFSSHVGSQAVTTTHFEGLFRLTASHSFCYIEQQQQTSFGCRIALSQSVVLQMLEELQVSPQVACAMLGEPDYWAPGDFVSHGINGAAQKLGSCSGFPQPKRPEC